VGSEITASPRIRILVVLLAVESIGIEPLPQQGLPVAIVILGRAQLPERLSEVLWEATFLVFVEPLVETVLDVLALLFVWEIRLADRSRVARDGVLEGFVVFEPTPMRIDSWR